MLVGFGAFLEAAIADAGYPTPTHFARAVTASDGKPLDPSVVFRWISEEQRPTVRSIERIAPVLGLRVNEVISAAYPDRLGTAEPVERPQMHPRAYELGRILADNSAVPVEDREALASTLDKMFEHYRRIMRRRHSA